MPDVIAVSRYRAASIEQTCTACPSQWEGKLAGGRMFYVRYRWGILAVNISAKPTDDVMDAVAAQHAEFDPRPAVKTSCDHETAVANIVGLEHEAASTCDHALLAFAATDQSEADRLEVVVQFL